MQIDALILSFDDPEGLRNTIELVRKTRAARIIVAYGCSQGQDYSFARNMDDSRLILLRERTRLGKANSLNNALKLVRSEIVAVMSSDITFDPDCFEMANAYFEQNHVAGLVPSVKPLHKDGAVSGAGRLLWSLRNTLLSQNDSNSESVHGGEMLFLRTEHLSDLPNVVNDEEFLCLSLEMKKLRVRYAPDIVVENRVPSNTHDYLLQRKRVIFGHTEMKKFGFNPAVLDFMLPAHPIRFLSVLFLTVLKRPMEASFLPLLLVLEAIALISSRNYGSTSNPTLWDFAKSTKALPNTLTGGLNK